MNVENLKCAREKHWSEIDDSERVKRLRETVKRLQYAVRKLEAAVRSLRHHEHGGDGKIVVRLGYEEGEPESTGSRRTDDDVYF